MLTGDLSGVVAPFLTFSNENYYARRAGTAVKGDKHASLYDRAKFSRAIERNP
jgi:hypothetical protein